MSRRQRGASQQAAGAGGAALQTEALQQEPLGLTERVPSVQERLRDAEGAREQRKTDREVADALTGSTARVEASPQRALTTVIPKVEALVAQLKAPAASSSSAASPSTRQRLEEDLLVAAVEGSEERVRELLEAGADVDARSPFGDTPLLLAAGGGRADVVALLLGSGADARAKDMFGRMALHCTAFDSTGRCAALLLGAGADVRCTDNGGWTPLHSAAVTGNEATVRVLLAAGADRTARDGEGKTPLDHADSEAVRRLLRG